MREIVKYESADGKREFSSAAACLSYEQECREVAEIMRPLPVAIDRKCDFANGGGYVAHDPYIVEGIRRKLIDLFRAKYDTYSNDVDPYERHVSWFCRACDDYGGTALGRAFSRLYCIDQHGREWGQAYYALNPDKGTQEPWPATTTAPQQGQGGK